MWMIALDITLSPLVSWSNHDDLWCTMPQCFKEKKNCYHWLLKLLFTSCQIFIPGHRQFHIRTTDYTVKVLIAITPQGSACFLSKAWGGRTSDKFENDNCGILKKILPGDFSFSRPWFYRTGKSHVLSYPIAYSSIHCRKRAAWPGGCWVKKGYC